MRFLDTGEKRNRKDHPANFYPIFRQFLRNHPEPQLSGLLKKQKWKHRSYSTIKYLSETNGLIRSVKIYAIEIERERKTNGGGSVDLERRGH